MVKGKELRLSANCRGEKRNVVHGSADFNMCTLPGTFLTSRSAYMPQLVAPSLGPFFVRDLRKRFPGGGGRRLKALRRLPMRRW